MALPKLADAGETMVVFNPARFPRPIRLIFKNEDEDGNVTYPDEVYTMTGSADPNSKGENTLGRREYEALLRACGEIEGEEHLAVPETKGIFNAGPGGLQINDRIAKQSELIKQGKLAITEVADQREAVAIAKSISFTQADAEAEIKRLHDREPEPGELKKYAADREQELLGEIFDKTDFSTVQAAARVRLAPKQKLERGLIDEETAQHLTHAKKSQSKVDIGQVNIVERVLNMSADEAIEMVSTRLTPAWAGNQPDLVKIYRQEKRKTVKEAIEQRLIGARLEPKRSGEEGTELTAENVKDFLTGGLK